MPKHTHAGGVVVRTANGRRQYLMVRGRRSNAWVFPKGRVERGETLQQTARREVAEEAGVRARVVALVGEDTFHSTRGRVHAAYFVMSYTGEVAPAEDRKRRWSGYERAWDELGYDSLRTLLEDARDLLDDVAAPAAARSRSAARKKR